jgi:hypothetical protein
MLPIKSYTSVKIYMASKKGETSQKSRNLITNHVFFCVFCHHNCIKPLVMEEHDRAQQKLKVIVPFLSNQKNEGWLTPSHAPFFPKDIDQNLK